MWVRIGMAALPTAVAAFAVAATTASAEAPEFGRCAKVANGTGVYANAGCTEAGGERSDEWLPGPGPKRGFSESVSGEEAFVWKLASNEYHLCKAVSATGEYTGPKTVGHVVIVLSGCTVEREPCETVVLAPMHGEIGVYELGETAATNKLGVKLSPESGEQLAELRCPGALVNPYIWRGGSVIAPITSNKMLLKEALKYRQRHYRGGREEQLPPSFVGEAPDPLEAGGGGRIFEPMGWKTSPKLVNEEKIEANSVV